MWHLLEILRTVTFLKLLIISSYVLVNGTAKFQMHSDGISIQLVRYSSTDIPQILYQRCDSTLFIVIMKIVERILASSVPEVVNIMF